MIHTLNIAAAAAFSCTLDRKALGAALTLAAKVTERRNTIPILSMVRLDMAGDQLTLTATDLDMALSQALPAEEAVPGSLCVDLTALGASVRKMKGARVRILDIGGRIVLTDTETGGSVRIPTLPATDWPVMGEPLDPACFTIPAAQFVADLARIRPAVSTEETRYYLNGIHFHPYRSERPVERTAEHEAATVELDETKAAYQLLLDDNGAVKEGAEALAETAAERMAALREDCERHEAERCAPDSLRMVATDGHRLHYVTRPLPDGADRLAGVILPRKAIAVMLAALGKKAAGEVGLAMTREKFAADLGGAVQLRGKMIDGTFPDYTRVIPCANEKVLTIGVGEIVQTVQSATAHCGERNRAVGISLCEEAVIFSATSPESGTAAAQAHGAEFKGDEMAIGFNAKYLVDVAQAFGDAVLAINLADAAAPTLFRSPAVPEFEAVLMPMRIDGSVLRLADVERMNRSPWDSFAEDVAIPARTGKWKEVGRLVRAVREYLGNNAVERSAQRFAIKFAILAAQNDPERLTRLSDVHAALAAGPRGSFLNLGATIPPAIVPLEPVAAVQPDAGAEAEANRHMALAIAYLARFAGLADIAVPAVPVPPVPAEVEAPAVQAPQEPAPAADAPVGPPDRVAALEARLAALEAIIAGGSPVAVAEIQVHKDPAAENVAPDPAPLIAPIIERGEREALEAEIDQLRATVGAQAALIARLTGGRQRAAGRVRFMRGALKREAGINKQLLGQVADMLKRREEPTAPAQPLPALPPLPASLQPPRTGGRIAMGITIAELREIAGLTSDEIVGWETQIKIGYGRAAYWPEHFRGPRVTAFERGASLARSFLAMRSGYGIARRKVRNRDFKEYGATTCTMLASRMPAADRHAEQLQTFREAVAVRDRVSASAAPEPKEKGES